MDLDDLDGVIAAPEHHTVLFENDVVRVLETTIRVGDTTALHTHLTPTTLYVVSGSHFVRRDQDGAVLVDTRADPSYVMPRVQFAAGIPRHTLHNPGPDDLVLIGVELKGAAGASSA